MFFSDVLVPSLALLGGGTVVNAVPLTPRDASGGCGTEHDFIGSTREFSIESSGGTRSYRIHLPSSYEIGTPMPLLIAYHGSGGISADFESTTRFSDESLNPDMVTVYPQGVNKNWQGPTYATPGVSDKVFTTDLVNHIKDKYCIDTARVYATGHSNGGGFVNTLACSPGHGGQFAAFAPISGAFYTDVNGDDSCHPQRSPLPLLEIHGGADDVIPYGGGDGRGGPLPAVDEWLGRWAGRNACGSNDVDDLDAGVHHTTWHCDGGDGLLQHYKMDGHDHSYPGPDSEIDGSQLVIDFLKQFSIP